MATGRTRVVLGVLVLVLGLVLAVAALGASSDDGGSDDGPPIGISPTTIDEDPDIGDPEDEASVVPLGVELPPLDAALLSPEDWADVRTATAGLDHAAREQVLDLLLYFQRRHAETVVATQEATVRDLLDADEVSGDEWEEVATQILYSDEWETVLDEVRESLPPEALAWFTDLLGRLQVSHAEGLAAAQAATASAVLDGAAIGPLAGAGTASDDGDETAFVGDGGGDDRDRSSDGDSDALTIVGAVSGALAALAGLATAVSGLYGVARARRLAAKRRAASPPPEPKP